MIEQNTIQNHTILMFLVYAYPVPISNIHKEKS